MSRQPIAQLSPGLVNRIAAGEVIERPASVVKELVENALDAGAMSITVEVEEGGRTLIRVVDDGAGIPAAELPLAFASHATSKLTADEDLFRISTMGFRGEALASIGAVTHARILSRTADQGAAYEIFNRGGVITQPQAAAGNAGTMAEVRNLFFNTPARRKFLKTPASEFGHISDMVMRLALPFPKVRFELLHNGKRVLNLPATTALERWLAAWPDDFGERRLELEARDAEIRMGGVIGLPGLARVTPKHQFFYLNGRVIRDRFIQHALREAYRGLMEPGRHPAAILMLTIPPGDVDVNVHPTKSEVRFRDSGRIHGLVMSGVRERLVAGNLMPRAEPWALEKEDAQRQDLRAKLADFFKANMPDPEPTLPQVATGAPVTAVAMPGISLTPLPAASVPAAAPVSQSSPPPGIPAIQLHNSYLVAESDDGLVIIDQHALHERIMYEELKLRPARGPLESQRMLIPPTLPASEKQQEMLTQLRPLLARLGIEADAIGPGAIAIHAFPSFLRRLDPADFMRELLERGEQESLDMHEEELLHEVLDMMACKAAVKAGDPLSDEEIAALLARRNLIDRASNCPHGRPTTLRLTLRDLEKQFKRTGF